MPQSWLARVPGRERESKVFESSTGVATYLIVPLENRQRLSGMPQKENGGSLRLPSSCLSWSIEGAFVRQDSGANVEKRPKALHRRREGCHSEAVPDKVPVSESGRKPVPPPTGGTGRNAVRSCQPSGK